MKKCYLLLIFRVNTKSFASGQGLAGSVADRDLNILMMGYSMKNFYLSLIATTLCFITGILANIAALTMELEGVRLYLATGVAITCIPLGLAMAYSCYQERKSIKSNI